MSPSCSSSRRFIAGLRAAGDRTDAAKSRRGGEGRGRRLRPITLLLTVLLVSGCSARAADLVRPRPEALPAGSPLRSRTLSDGDAWLRHHLMYREHDQALSMLAHPRAAPADGLLQALQMGLVLHQSGVYHESNDWFSWAEAEADRRYTRSLARAAATLVVSDRVLAYIPSRAELVMIPYYRILNYLAADDRSGALVEARKASALLARVAGDSATACGEVGMLHYLSGLVFSAGNEANDALVSFRNAETAFGRCGSSEQGVPPEGFAADLYRAAMRLGIEEIADSVAYRYSIPEPGGPAAEDAGDLLILIEDGFVAHRAEQALHVPVLPEEIDGLGSGDDNAIVAAAAAITTRLIGNVAEKEQWGSTWDDQPWTRWNYAMDGAHILRLSWPVSRRESARPASVRVMVNDSVASVTTVGDLSASMERDLEGNHAAILARMLARGVTKYLISRELEKKAEKKGGELAGFITARLANYAANEMERADTRSWSLLPDQISISRLRLAPGSYRVVVETLSAGGEIIASRDHGEVMVTPGGLTVVQQRLWGPADGCGRRDVEEWRWECSMEERLPA